MSIVRVVTSPTPSDAGGYTISAMFARDLAGRACRSHHPPFFSFSDVLIMRAGRVEESEREAEEMGSKRLARAASRSERVLEKRAGSLDGALGLETSLLHPTVVGEEAAS